MNKLPWMDTSLNFMSAYSFAIPSHMQTWLDYFRIHLFDPVECKTNILSHLAILHYSVNINRRCQKTNINCAAPIIMTHRNVMTIGHFSFPRRLILRLRLQSAPSPARRRQIV